MGRPLWREPDDSKKPSREPSRSSTDPAIGRSSIRRPTSPQSHAESARRRRLREAREQRLRTLLAAQRNYENNLPSPIRLEARGAANDVMSTDPDPFSPDRLMVGRHNEDPLEPLEVELLQRADDEDHPSEIPPPRAGDEETHQTPPGEHTHRLLRLLRSRSSRDRGVPSMLATFQDPDFRHAAARMIGRDDLASTWRGYLHGDNNPGAYPIPRRTVRSQQHSPTLNVPEQPAVGIERDSRENRRQATEAANRRRLRFGDHSRSVRLVDGLGDRDRSLSPEGDGVWDTLQSTLTPDPQPPSVGSSFASTSASTATSQHPTVPSSRTSITGPSEDVEPPCDPVNEPEGFVEGSEDAEAPHLDQPRRSSPHGRLSYAEAAVSGTGSSTGEPEWLPGMHHIIRRLAARQDIPDEWWQQAGLSRSMSWESIN